MRCRRILNYYHLGTKKESKSLVSSFLHEKIRAKAGKERLKNSSHVHPNGVGPRSVTLPKKSQKWKRVLNEKETLEIRKKE